MKKLIAFLIGLFVAHAAWPCFDLKEDTASQEWCFVLYDESDGTIHTGETIANTEVEIYKSGSTTHTDKNSGGCTEEGSSGKYCCTFDATDTDTAGSMKVTIVNSGSLVNQYNLCVLTDNWYDSKYGTENLHSDALEISSDSTAANNAESFFDGTGYAGTGNTIPTVTTASTCTALGANAVDNTSTNLTENLNCLLADSASHGGSNFVLTGDRIDLDSSNGAALQLTGALNNHGIYALGNGSGYGIYAEGGATDSPGVVFEGGGANGDAFSLRYTGTGVAIEDNQTSSFVEVDVGSISKDTTAATNAEAFFDGTGYAGTGNTIPTVTDVTNLHASAATAAELAKVPKSDGTASWNATALAAIEAEATDAIEADGLHYLINTALPTNWATDVTNNSALDYLADDGTAVFDRSTDSLQEIRDNQAGADTAAIANAVWDELITESRTEDSYGNAVGDFLAEDAGGVYAMAKLDEDSTTMDLNATTFGTVGTLTGHTAQTGDTYALANSGTYGFAQLVRSTTPANTLDITAGGEAGIALDNASGQLDAANVGEWAIIDTGTAAAVADGSITLDGTPGFSADELNDGASVVILSATTGAGQCRLISDFGVAANRADLSSNWTTTPTGTVTYAVLPGVLCAAIAEVSDTTTALQVGADGLIECNVEEISDTDVAAAQQAGYMPSTIADNTSAGGIQTTSGAVDTVTTTTTATTCTSVTNNVGLTAQAIDDILDEPLAGHTTEDTLGKEVADAGGAGDPWSTSVPGAYGAGTAGNILGNRLDVATSTLATAAALTTVDDYVDTEVAAIKAATDNLPADPADDSDIDAQLLAIDNYVDTEVAAIVTNTTNIEADTQDLQTQVGTAGAGLTDLGGMSTAMKAEVNQEADTALSDYDAPTATELAMMVLMDATYLKCTVDSANFTPTNTQFQCDLTDKNDQSVTSATDKLEGSIILFSNGNNQYERRSISSTVWDGTNSELKLTLPRALPNNAANGDIGYIF